VRSYRLITVAVGVGMFVDATLYLAVLPLLPTYAARFHFSTTGAAVLLAAYPAAAPILAIGGIWLLPRFGGRTVTLASAGVMTGATVAFALAPNTTVLIGARFMQGLASGAIWTASMAWVTYNAPAGRRGRESGIVMGMLSTGSVVGPGIGGLAAAAGTQIAFGLVAAVSAAGVVICIAAPAGLAVAREVAVRSSVGRALRQPAVRAALAVSLIDPLVFATIDLLVPLDLGRRGASTTMIATAFTVGAAIAAVTAPIAGRVVDRVGAGRVALVTGTVVALTPIPFAVGLSVTGELAMLVVLSPVFAAVAASIYPLASAGADTAGVAHGVVNAVLGSLWAVGFSVVPIAAGLTAERAGQSATFLVAAFLCLVPLSVLAAATLPQWRATPRRSG
jgi:MFS family permease